MLCLRLLIVQRIPFEEGNEKENQYHKCDGRYFVCGCYYGCFLHMFPRISVGLGNIQSLILRCLLFAHNCELWDFVDTKTKRHCLCMGFSFYDSDLLEWNEDYIVESKFP
ncbi:CLUMA_CG012263, isoform A [Clunio marinus]|uniref:CLUMA_CG012263, isoform A n=1 Tax=Clunio marinus TaxID=568069 RepID=A0A1J1IEJ3_9DIPT|nr:CLUMA_CG012263, isoform A [Clunio marinus]